MNDESKPFPILGRNNGTVPWWLAEEAYNFYTQQYGSSQTLKRIAERGGFGKREILMLLRKEKCC